MNYSAEMIRKARTAASAEELLAMAKAEGIELAAEEAGRYFEFLHSSKELSDEELEQVAGGKGDDSNIYKYCKYCGQETSQRYLQDDIGWDANGTQHKCHLWSCYKCNNTNYYDVYTGKLI